MSIKKLNDYLKKPDPPLKGGKTLTPVLFSDSKGNYVERQIRPGISREIKFWSEKGRTTKKGVQWLRDNIATKIGQLDNISIYVWLGTCDLSCYNYKTKYIELHPDPYEATKDTVDNLNEIVKIVQNYSGCKVTLLEVPPILIYHWNKSRDHRTLTSISTRIVCCKSAELGAAYQTRDRSPKTLTLTSREQLKTKREVHLEFKTTGGGLVITADAATFELIKQATAIYYTRMTGENILIQEEKDKSNNIIVQHSYKYSSNDYCYTVNFYNTKSKLLVNGKDQNRFVDVDLIEIRQIAQNAKCGNSKVNLAHLNNLMRERLEQSVGAKTTPAPCDRNINPCIECIKCKKNCRTRGAYCTTGKHWVHYKCQNLISQEIVEIELEAIEGEANNTQIVQTSRPTDGHYEQLTLPTCSNNALSILADAGAVREEEPQSEPTNHQQANPKATSCPADVHIDAPAAKAPKSKQDQTDTKTKDMRDRELKLRKAEEQFKIREKTLKEDQAKTIQLETRVQYLEARNFELEPLVTTMRRRLEELQGNGSTTDHKQQPREEQTGIFE
ncbi:unnamed protein product [Mytilus coruscus]|uniref:Uncharacterized protein n=1 Tax=Mytilus coruscus TaxID=42192 RepID=A0A6J8BV01_MYTCO|nr:unnamed protein product [Mytilus coruscus]